MSLARCHRDRGIFSKLFVVSLSLSAFAHSDFFAFTLSFNVERKFVLLSYQKFCGSWKITTYILFSILFWTDWRREAQFISMTAQKVSNFNWYQISRMATDFAKSSLNFGSFCQKIFGSKSAFSNNGRLWAVEKFWILEKKLQNFSFWKNDKFWHAALTLITQFRIAQNFFSNFDISQKVWSFMQKRAKKIQAEKALSLAWSAVAREIKNSTKVPAVDSRCQNRDARCCFCRRRNIVKSADLGGETKQVDRKQITFGRYWSCPQETSTLDGLQALTLTPNRLISWCHIAQRLVNKWKMMKHLVCDQTSKRGQRLTNHRMILTKGKNLRFSGGISEWGKIPLSLDLRKLCVRWHPMCTRSSPSSLTLIQNQYHFPSNHLDSKSGRWSKSTNRDWEQVFLEAAAAEDFSIKF